MLAQRVTIDPGTACVRYSDSWWNVSILLNKSKRPMTMPSWSSEAEAKNFVLTYFPNCNTFVSSADMMAEVEHRRSPGYYYDPTTDL